MTHRMRAVPLFLALAMIPGAGFAQDAPPPAPQEKSEERPTGLPSRVKWTFNLDAGWGTFGFANSLYNNPKDPGVEENLSDQWFEGYVKPAISGAYRFTSSGELYGKASVVGERTYGSAPDLYGQDVSSFGPEDLYIGWRSGDTLAIGENALDVTVGRAPYQLAHGMLLYDGASEGGSRGGYWTNARKSFELAAIGRLKPGPHTVEVFYLDKDELPESDSGSRLWGVNYEVALGTATTVGATYMKWFAHADVAPERDGLNVFNLRAYSAPLAAAPTLSFEVEYASERNGDALHSHAWTVQGAYELGDVSWTPTLSYRYAFFQGDNPLTRANEAFDPLSPGFHDWGTWWQGEIAGEYFLANSNLKSHLVRVHAAPNDSLGGGLMFYQFNLDRPLTFGRPVTATDVAFEIDAYTDWDVNENVTLSFLGAFADPGKAVQQATGRTKNFVYGMVYVGYNF